MTISFKKHELFPDEIIIRDFIGHVFVDQIIQSWEYLLKEELISNELKGVINNISECALEMTMPGFERLIAFLKSHEEFKRYKLAVICSDPKKIVFPMLGQNRESELKIRPFATVQSAVDWIIYE